MKVVITGASGFIGQTLSRLLRKQDGKVDGYTRGSERGLISVSAYEELSSVDDAVLVHLAQNSNTSAAYDPGEVKLCRILAAKSWRHIVYASSAVVYGDQHAHARKPDEPVFPVSDYARMKIECEQVFVEAGGTCLRFSNLYGPRMPDHSVVADILRQVPGNGPLKLNDPTPVRDFLWIEDAAGCIAAACAASVVGIINAGSGQAVTVGELARLVLNLVGEQARSVIAENELTRSSSLRLDITKTQSLLSWLPKTNLNSGLSSLLSTNCAKQ